MTEYTEYYEQKRGLVSVHGKEAVQFLNGLITNDVAKLEEGGQMPAAFPNAQGRLLAVVRVMRQGDKFLFDTEEATHDKVYTNLFRFTFAGDFYVTDLSEQFRFFSVFDRSYLPASRPAISFKSPAGTDYFVPRKDVEDFLGELGNLNAAEISDEEFEVIRIESGIPKYGVDMDETTIVPELGLDGLISYDKGCYIGQEIIARIHFRGHVAKRLTGLVLEPPVADGDELPLLANAELNTTEGKNAGRITSSTYSSKLRNQIALGYVRYDFLDEGTELRLGDRTFRVKSLPFV